MVNLIPTVPAKQQPPDYQTHVAQTQNGNDAPSAPQHPPLHHFQSHLQLSQNPNSNVQEAPQTIAPDPSENNADDQKSTDEINLEVKENQAERFDEGYCLLFLRRTKYFELTIQDSQILKLTIRSDINDELRDKANKAMSEFENCDNFLKNLHKAKIRYCVEYSCDDEETYVMVFISISHYHVQKWMSQHNIDLPINTYEAVKLGRKIDDFTLAHRTHLGDTSDDVNFEDKRLSQGIEQRISARGLLFPKLPLSSWNYIHVNFDPTLPHKNLLYQHHEPHGALIHNTVYLRALYDILTESVPLGGADFKVRNCIRLRDHPLKDMFAINMFDINEYNNANGKFESRFQPKIKKSELFFPQLHNMWNQKVNEIRNYYGELVAFYFAFLAHYQKWLYPIAIVGTFWYIIQTSAQKIAVPGTGFIVIIALIWANLMIEHWSRVENDLLFRWGLLRFRDTQLPRPSFSGIFIVSPVNGDLIETFESVVKYYSKIFFSVSTMLLCIAAVVSIVVGLWTLQAMWGENSSTISVLVGIVNAIQIQVMNHLYTYLAIMLNEYEGHRLEQDYYNHLVIKRIFFLFINSFNSLFYLAFFRNDNVYKKSHDSDDKRLNDARTQLITLFLSMIAFQNFIEVLLPLLKAQVLKRIDTKRSGKYQKHAGIVNVETSFFSLNQPQR